MCFLWTLAGVKRRRGAVDSYSEQKQKAALEEVNAAEEALAKARRTGASEEDLSQMERVYTEAKAKEESWREGGASKRKLDTVAVTLGVILSGGSAGEVAATAISPELNAQIHKYTSDNKTANLLAHAALSALEAGISGNNALAGAASGVAGEASAMLLSEVVFNKEASQLSEEERELLSVAGQLSGALVGNGMGGNTAGTLQGIETAKRAVENNYLSAQEAARKLELEMLIQTTSDSEERRAYEEEKAALEEKDQRTQREIEEYCPRFGKGSAACQASIADAQKARLSYESYTNQIQNVGYGKDNRQYKVIFGTDYARAVEALKGKDAVTIQKEIFAAEVAKQKGTTPAEEYKWVSNGIDLG
ncbi:VENN motif pre-toxin domain-containing protein [Actinobacillus equuli]|uniref:VENN motif pre-toxin domain-containing protein n=1 Tax=Actinobacillus equuli TaxID=718 RepID=UPI0024183AC2|nr:VENN motif pre-toxin domain-containing protein [Actinobacillus equuli]MDG4952732.1 VENN motif pre-toxin domain-containing protein [Actinobacillus equuli subsp. equuli]